MLISAALGDITVEIYQARAPISASHFLEYVDEQRYDDASFYRVVRPDNQPNDAVKCAGWMLCGEFSNCPPMDKRSGRK